MSHLHVHVKKEQKTTRITRT